MSRVVRAASFVLFASLAWSTLPQLVGLLRSARNLRPLSYEARRERLMGPFYASVERLRREVPPGAPIAFIGSLSGADGALFANDYMFPRRTRVYANRAAYRNAANDPLRPATIVVAGEVLRLTTYNDLRRAELRAGPRVVRVPALSPPRRAFTLPIATSVDGPDPDTYVIEAALASSSTLPVNVRATFYPGGIVKTLTIAPRATLTFYDLVDQLFAMTESGWMRIESSQPLRAAFYFVNRGRRDATLLPDAGKPAVVEPAPLQRDAKLWILNASERDVNVTIGKETLNFPPHALIARPITSLPTVSGEVFAYVTMRELNGRTRFLWPAGATEKQP